MSDNRCEDRLGLLLSPEICDYMTDERGEVNPDKEPMLNMIARATAVVQRYNNFLKTYFIKSKVLPENEVALKDLLTQASRHDEDVARWLEDLKKFPHEDREKFMIILMDSIDHNRRSIKAALN